MKPSEIDQRFLDLMHRIETEQKREILDLTQRMDAVEQQVLSMTQTYMAMTEQFARQCDLLTSLNEKFDVLLGPLGP